MTEKMLGFEPIIAAKPFECFWSINDAWGNVSIGSDKITLSVLYGETELKKFVLPEGTVVKTVCADGNDIPFTMDGNTAIFENAVSVKNSVVFM